MAIPRWLRLNIGGRKRAEQSLRDSELRLNAIIASAMDAIIAVDEDLHIVLFNAAAEQIYGYKAADILGQSLDRLMPERFRAAHRQHIARFARSQSGPRRLGADGGIVGLRANGQEFPVETAISQISTDGKTLYMAIVRDITERRRDEDALRESEAQLSGIISSAMDAIITVDEDQRIVLFNAAAEQMFGYRESYILGQTLDVLIPERFRAVHREHLHDFGHTQVTRRQMGALATVFGLSADGKEFPIEASISQLSLGNRKHYTVILRDVSKRLEAEEQIRNDASRIKALAQRVQGAQEAERRRLAYELHDEIGQVLTAVKLNIEGLGRQYPDESMATRLKESTALVDRAIQQVRDRALDLRPSMLDDLGLIPALSWYLERQAQHGGLQMEFKVPAERPEISPAIETAVYRVVQEAVTNCLRHAQASRLQVALRQRDSLLEIGIQDDGVGFDLPAIEGTNESLGLTSMRERIELLETARCLSNQRRDTARWCVQRYTCNGHK